MTRSFTAFYTAVFAFSVIAQAAVPTGALANHDPFGGAPQTSVTICHATGNGSFVNNSPSINSHTGAPNGHGDHANDIIPPYHYLDNNNVLQSYPGVNWTTEGQAIYNNGCAVLPPPVTHSISGYKFNDLNVNGVWDQGEPALGGWTMVLNDNATATTDQNGYFTFEGLLPGNYTVCEQQQDGWTQIYPNNYECHSVTLVSSNISDVNFGNRINTTLSGYKFNDLNGNGQWNEGEPGLSGWQILIFGPNFSTSTFTGPGGFWALGGAFPEGTYTLCEIQQGGWTQTYPGQDTEGCNVVQLGEQNISNINFGNHLNPTQTFSISGHKFDDHEQGLEGWTITLSGNEQSLGSTQTDGDGYYTFSGLSAGTYTVCEVMQNGWEQVSPDGCYTIELPMDNQDGNASGVNFVNRLIPPPDVCPNLEGTQETVPQGYVLVDGQCVVVPPTDVCPNLDGVQETVPEGYQLVDGQCVRATTDMCPNIEGTQTSVPEGMVVDNEGNCVVPPTDVCPNLEGVQTSVPQGYEMVDGQCVVPTPSSSTGGSGSPPPPPPANPILTIIKTVAETFTTPGSTINYTIVVTNNGPGTATNVVLTDTLPGGMTYTVPPGGSTRSWNFSDMPANTSQTVTYTVVVDDAAVPGTYINTASVNAANHPSVSASANIEVRPGQVLGFTTIPKTGGPSSPFALPLFLLMIPAILVAVIVDVRKRKQLAKATAFRMYLL